MSNPPDFKKAPNTTEAFTALVNQGYMPAHPPADYGGSLADWCVAMASRGYPADYAALTGIMVPEAVWESVLKECEA